MLTNIKLSKAQFSKIIQSGRNLGRTLGNLGKKELLDFAVPLAKDVLFKAVTKATLSALDKLERKVRGEGAVRAEKGFNFFISNEDMNDIFKIVESLKKSVLVIDGAAETVKHEIEKKKVDFFGLYDGTNGCFIDSTYRFFINTTCIFFFEKCYIWKISQESRKRTRRRNYSIISVTFNDKSSGKKRQKSWKRI